MAKTIIGKFFAGVWEFLTGADKAWDKVDEEIKDGIQTASGVISVVNEYINEAPSFVFEIIQDRYPSLTQDKIKGSLEEVAREAGIITSAISPDLFETIRHLQEYLQSKKGPFWARASKSLAEILAIILTPNGTKFAIISSLMEYAYRKFIKK